MKAYFGNYFKDGVLWQWDKNRNIYSITDVPEIKEEFCLDQKGMEVFLKYNEPEIKIDGSLKIKSGKNKATIKISGEPLIKPNMKFDEECKVNVDLLKKAAKFVADATVDKPILTGVNIGEHAITATDKFFAFRTEIEGSKSITLIPEFIKEMLSCKGEITLKMSDRNVAFKSDEGTVYVSKLLDGSYPLLDKIYFNMPTKTFQIEKSVMQGILSYAVDKDSNVILSPNRIQILGDIDFDFDVELAVDCSIVLPLNRLATVISCVDSKYLIFSYSTETTPVFIDKHYLILPRQM